MKAPELKEKLQESEKLIQEMTVTWEEKLRKTEEIAAVSTSHHIIKRKSPSVHISTVTICVDRSGRSSWRAWASLWKLQGSKWEKTSVSWST